MYFASRITKPGQILDSDRLSRKRRQTAQDRHGQPGVRGVFENKGPRGRHPHS